VLRECEAYVRAGMDQPPVIYIAEDDVGDFMASRTPDGDEPWEPLYRHPMPPADECEELLLIAHMDGYHKGKKVPEGMQLVPDGYIDRAEKSITEACCNAVEKLNELAPEMGWDSGEKVAEIYIRSLRKAARGES